MTVSYGHACNHAQKVFNHGGLTVARCQDSKVAMNQQNIWSVCIICWHKSMKGVIWFLILSNFLKIYFSTLISIVRFGPVTKSLMLGVPQQYTYSLSNLFAFFTVNRIVHDVYSNLLKSPMFHKRYTDDKINRNKPSREISKSPLHKPQNYQLNRTPTERSWPTNWKWTLKTWQKNCCCKCGWPTNVINYVRRNSLSELNTMGMFNGTDNIVNELFKNIL